MLSQAILTRIYELILLAVAIFAFFRYKKVDRCLRYVFFWVWLGVATEGIGEITVALFKTNLPVYATSSLLELVIICLYFNESTSLLKRKSLGIIIGGTGVLLGILNIIFLQPLNSINSNFLFLECQVIVCLSLYAIFRILITPGVRPLRETHFWIASIFVFYECVSLWDWGIYDYIMQSHPEKSAILNMTFLIANSITYLLCGIIIYLYPKMRQTHV